MVAAAAGKTAANHGRVLESAFVLAGNDLLQLPSASIAMSDDTTPPTTPDWLVDGPWPAPVTLKTKEFATKIGDAFESPDITDKLVRAFLHMGALTCLDLHDTYIHDAEEALSIDSVNLPPKAWIRNLRNYLFRTTDKDFKVLDSRSASNISNSSNGSSHTVLSNEDERNGERYLPFEKMKNSATVAIGGMDSWSLFDFPEETHNQLHKHLAVGKIEDTLALHDVFKFTLLVFQTRYISSAQKTRYAALLHRHNRSISIAGWQATLTSGFNNRRGGRFDKLRFNPSEFSDFMMQIATEYDKFQGKLITCPHEPRLLPVGTLEKTDISVRAAAFIFSQGRARLCAASDASAASETKCFRARARWTQVRRRIRPQAPRRLSASQAAKLRACRCRCPRRCCPRHCSPRCR